jgi:hypothetical protein
MMSVMKRMGRVLALALPLLLVTASGASAQQVSSSEQMARNIFEAGRAAYEAGRFDQALRYFQEAYDLSQRPALLFNIASAADRLQENQRAIEAYRAYLRAVPNADNRELAESRIAFLEGVLARQGGGGETTTSEGGTNVATSEEAARTVVQPGQRDTGTRPSGGGDVTGEWWFWTIIAVVAVGAIVGIAAGVAVATGGVDEPPPGDVPPVQALVQF